MIKKDKYLNQLIKSKEYGFPKIITEIKRCGKSYLLEKIYKNYLISSGINKNNIIIVDLDKDENFNLLFTISLMIFTIIGYFNS